MKELLTCVAAITLLLPIGCGANSAADSGKVSIDTAIEIQIAVVAGLNQGDAMTDGDWRVAATCVLPIHSAGGPGHILSSTDGTIIELQWADVRMIHHGRTIAFDDCRWRVRNRIDRRDGVSQNLAGHRLNPATCFGEEFEWLASCELDTTGHSKSDRRLVIRGRMLPETPPVQPLNLAELTESTR